MCTGHGRACTLGPPTSSSPSNCRRQAACLQQAQDEREGIGFIFIPLVHAMVPMLGPLGQNLALIGQTGQILWRAFSVGVELKRRRACTLKRCARKFIVIPENI